ncbi:hypothetical protein CAPTEDRAFT_188302 [Capitella teleta]|uniref:Uncharacterized protein n=1 Tax=Capitella teleta TaxID=283909 RepID=R7TWD5_CAPTE|nr:hypothetical protein CAPTEDRAFT_188302 [Capitella teleta]|eukprot:ELT97892.1 hypothetical protein CAPTEDRAFT_188302 [Capitella teleta]
MTNNDCANPCAYFCHGDLPDDVTQSRHGSSSLVHWVQRESFPILPGRGALYCGDCCGQQLAQKECDRQFEKHHKHGCFNWVKCFMDECKRVFEKVGAHEELGCELPPAPYPKHFHPDPHTLPPSSHRRSTSEAPTSEATGSCSEAACRKLQMLERCHKDCCADSCCLPDGLVETSGGGLPFDLSPAQLASLTLSTLLAIVVLIALIIFVSRKCRRRWRMTRVPQKDTQGLVIEEDEEDEQESDAVDPSA